MRSRGVFYHLGAVLFGVALGILMLELGLRAGGYVLLSVRDMNNRSGLFKAGQYRILCVGGSTTYMGGEDSYPSQLEGILNAQGLGVAFKVINAGVGGQDSCGVYINLESQLDAYRPDMVIGIVGNNDEGSGRKPYGTGGVADYVPEKPGPFSGFKVVKLAKLLSARLHTWAGGGKWFRTRASAGDDSDQSVVQEGLAQENGRPVRGPDFVAAAGVAPEPDGDASLPATQPQTADTGDADEPAPAPTSDPALPDAGLAGQEPAAREPEQPAAEETPESAPAQGAGIAPEPAGQTPPEAGGGEREGVTPQDGGDRKLSSMVIDSALNGDETPEIKEKIRLARLRLAQHRYADVKAVVGEILAKYPENVVALDLYATAMFWMGDNNGALEVRRRLIELDPGRAGNYFMYALSIRDYYHSEKARDMLEKAVMLAPDNNVFFAHLCTVLRSLGHTEREAEVLREVCGKRLVNHVLLGYSATCMLEMGNVEEARRYWALAQEQRMTHYNPRTLFYYPRIIDLVLGRGVKMVCAQDPVVGVEPLKKLLGYRTDVLYVDNEKVFKDVLEKGRYADYFNDNFGGEFGHATREGNRILASNIARAILKAYFGRDGLAGEDGKQPAA